MEAATYVSEKLLTERRGEEKEAGGGDWGVRNKRSRGKAFSRDPNRSSGGFLRSHFRGANPSTVRIRFHPGIRVSLSALRILGAENPRPRVKYPRSRVPVIPTRAPETAAATKAFLACVGSNDASDRVLLRIIPSIPSC